MNEVEQARRAFAEALRNWVISHGIDEDRFISDKEYRKECFELYGKKPS